MTTTRPPPLITTTATNANGTFIVSLLRTILTLGIASSILLGIYIARSDDTDELFGNLLNNNGGDAPVEVSAGARSLLVAIYSVIVTTTITNYFYRQEKYHLKAAFEEKNIGDESFVLASASCASHSFISFLLFGWFKLNLNEGLERGALAAFLFGVITLKMTILYGVLTFVVLRREKSSIVEIGAGDSVEISKTRFYFPAENDNWKVPTPGNNGKADDKPFVIVEEEMV